MVARFRRAEPEAGAGISLESRTESRFNRPTCRRIFFGYRGDGSAARLFRDIRMDILRRGVKPVRFLGDSLERLRECPEGVRHDAGYQIWRVQLGESAEDYRPMPTIGPGVEEIRVRDVTGAYRVVYTARLVDAVYVLHVFQKKSRATSRIDVEIAARRFKVLVRTRG